MNNSKNKILTALLAFFGGIVGLHRFYLGQIGLGILMIFLSLISLGAIGSIVGIIDSIIFLSMSNEKFEYKYNNPDQISRHRRRKPRYKSYERKHQTGGYTDEYKTSHRRDRRMGRRELGASDSPARASSTRRRTSKKDKYVRREAIKRIDELKESGIEKFKDYDIEGSIEDFMQILKIDPYNIAAHFNLACGYSQLEKPHKTMYHLSMAVNSGFDDFDRIRKHDKLAYARIQPEWEDFEKNGFKFDINKKETANIDLQPTVDSEQSMDLSHEQIESEKIRTGDLLKHLNKLKEQRERGIISDTEFELERRKLMSS